MGKVIDFPEYRSNRRNAEKPRDGIYLEAAPPFIVFQQYEAGVLRQEDHLLSEYLLREMFDSM